jgi:peroxiredoxin
MIKKIITLPVILLFIIPIATFASNSNTKKYKQILLDAFIECAKIKSGNYNVVYSQKFPFQEEIWNTGGRCSFSKVSSDKILGAHIDLTLFEEDGSMVRKLHDGQYEVEIYPQQHQARVSNLQQGGPYYIAGNAASGLLFKPLLPTILFTEKNKDFFQRSIKKRSLEIRQLDNDYLENRLCSVFEVHCKKSKNIQDEIITLFIDQEYNIPVKYIHQQVYWESPMYTSSTISNFKLSHQENPQCAMNARAEIPKDFKIIYDHEPENPKNQLLSAGTIAPPWKLPTTQGDILDLESLKGKVVLLSFWYKSFAPSLQYLEKLQVLQTQFKKKGLVIIGINLYDKKEELVEFLHQHHITYTNLIGDTKVQTAYLAHTPNTFYLIDQDGKVCYSTIEQTKFPRSVLVKHIQKLLTASS